MSRHFQSDWLAAQSTLTSQNQRMADWHHVPTPLILAEPEIWLSVRHLPLWTDSNKLASKFIRPYEVEKVINPSAVHLKSPAALKVCPVFHVSVVPSGHFGQFFL